MSWLKKKLEELAADVNVFDGGKTGASVRASRPAQTVSQPKTQPAQTFKVNDNSLTRGVSRLWDQANPYDEGRSWKTRTPTYKMSLYDQWKDANIDANTTQDFVRRNKAQQAQGITPTNQTYTQEQNALGRRAYTNPFESVVRNALVDPTARATNTAFAAGRNLRDGVMGLGDIAKESVFGTDQSYQQAINRTSQKLNRDYGKDGGLLNLGTNINDVKDLSDPLKFTGATLETGSDLASIVPAGMGLKQGINAAGKATTKLVSKQVIGNALVGSGSSMMSNFGQQVRETGKVDPLGVATAGVAGGALPIAGYGLGRVTTKLVSEVSPTVENLLTRANTAVNSLGQEGNVKVPGFTEFRIGSLRRQINNNDSKVAEATRQYRMGEITAKERNAVYKYYKDDTKRLRRQIGRLQVGGGGLADNSADEFIKNPLTGETIPNPNYKSVDPLESLKQEARKYKSAEEFVNSQIDAYHGTPKQFDEFKPSPSYSENRNASIGTWFSNDKNVADQFTYDSIYINSPETKTGRVIEARTGLKNPKIYESASPEITAKNKTKIAKLEQQKKEAIYQYDRNDLSTYDWRKDKASKDKIAEIDKQIKEIKRQSADSYDIFQAEADKFKNKADFVKHLQEQGHDGILIRKTAADANGKTNDQLVVFEPTQIKTRKQLTDLYNQATKRPKLNERGAVKNPFYKEDPSFKQDLQEAGLAPSEAKKYADTFGISEKEAAKQLEEIKKPVVKDMSKLKNSTKETLLSDMEGQEKYGLKAIQDEPVNNIDSVLNKYLDIEELSDEALDASNPKYKALGEWNEAREAIRKTNVARMATDKAAQGMEKLANGGKVSRKFNRALQYLSKNAGQDPDIVKAAKQYAGENTYTDSALLDFGRKAYDLVGDEKSRARVHSILDPEGNDLGLTFDKLTKNEKQAVNMLRDMGDAINDTSYRMGMISKKKWESNRGGRYIARLYKEVESAEDIADLLDIKEPNGLHLGMYKSRKEMNDELRKRLIKDPVKLATIRARQIRQNEALAKYMFTSEAKGYVSKVPKDGFVKVTKENRMHNWSGKYVRQDVFENIEGFRAMGKGMNAMNNLLDVYDGFLPRRIRKKMLTVYNPVVRTGNVTSNYFFAYLNGVNPRTFQKNKSWAKKAIKANDPLYIAAQKQGLVGNDLLRTDKNIFNAQKEFLTELDSNTQSTWAKAKGAPGKTDSVLSKRYGMADDIAKLSALKAHVDRGLSVNEAIKRTARGFQDYSRVGHAYDMAAKMPVFGNAFIRFQGDLWLNIVKNAAVDHPARLAAMVGGIYALGNAMSKWSGESAEDKKTREGRAGAPKIPFTDISTEFQTPWGAVDVARFTPLYMRQDVDGNSFVDDLSRMSPVNIPSSMDKNELVKKAASDPLIGPLVSMAGDTDWRGKSLKDPDGYRDGKPLFPDDPLSKGEEWRNRGQYAARSYLPYPFNEVGDIMAAANQDMKNEQSKRGGKNDPFNPNATPLGREGYNTAGSKKTVAQSIGRLFGVRAEQYGAKEAQEQRERNDMFAFFDKTDEFKKSLDSKTKEQFEARHASTATRDGIRKEFESDPWYKYKNASELLQNPKLLEAEKKYALMQNKYDGRPIDPVFNLPKDQQKMVLAKKMKLPGSKDEGFNSLYDQEWYQNFRQKQDEYYAAKSAYAKSKGWSDYESENPYPEAPKDVQLAMNQYFSLPSGTGQRSAFIRNNPEVWNAITAQWDKQNAWTDKERERLGLPAIDRSEDNKFSYNSGGRRGSGRKFDYKLDMFGGESSTSLTKALKKLIKEAELNKKS